LVLRTRSCTFLTVGLATILAGCGGEEPSAPATVAAPAPARTATAPRCVPVDHEPLGTSTTAYAAAARSSVAVYDAPGGSVVARFGRLNPNGVATVFGVLGRRLAEDCEPSWYRVQLPRRPNGRVGWVRARAVSLGTVRTRVLVDLSERRVTLYRGARKVITTRAAIGSSATPTPTGTYYVDQRLLTNDVGGPFGPGAVGIAAYSEVLTGWTQGGPIAIHGTNRPDLIGKAVSNGCIRVRNDVLRRIFAATPEGTPVAIQR
jgi:hypothetical protein